MSMDQSSTERNLFIIYSSESLSWIHSFLCGFGIGEPGIGDLLVIRNASGYETSRTLALLDESIWKDLLVAGYGVPNTGTDVSPKNRFGKSLTIVRYHLYPTPHRTYNLYLPLPKHLSGESVKDFLKAKLLLLCKFGILNMELFPRITVPLASREHDTPKGHAYISFVKETSLDTIALIKIYLSNTSWSETERVKVFWVRPKFETARDPNEQLLPETRPEYVYSVVNTYLASIHQDPLPLPLIR